MKVKLINYTKDALETLILTKNTRLMNTELTIDKIKAWTKKRKLEELNYMMNTIKSSFEFVDYIFIIEGVTRAFTHQLVRTRTGSYAQQSQRAVKMDDCSYHIPKSLMKKDQEKARIKYSMVIDKIHKAYHELIDEYGVPVQDARGVLPTNINTNIIAKFNLRTIHETSKQRLCVRTQGEYQDVFKEMKKAILKVHPWAKPLIRAHCVSTGFCCFPNYHGCPMQHHVYNPSNSIKLEELYKTIEFEAIPGK